MSARPSTRRASEPDARAVSAFKARLKTIPLATLLEKLDGPAQGPQWQRELAQEEADGRAPEPESTSAAPPRRRGVSLWGGLLAGALIAGSSAIVLYTVYQLWLM